MVHCALDIVMQHLKRVLHCCMTGGLFLVLNGLGASYAASPYEPVACTASVTDLGLQATDAAAVLMVLSPRMVYALREWPRMKAAAMAQGFEVVVRRDPLVSTDEWLAAVNAAGLPELNTAPVMEPGLAAQCGLLNHFPSTLVVRCGRVHPWPVLGVMPSELWQAVLTQRRESLLCP